MIRTLRLPESVAGAILLLATAATALVGAQEIGAQEIGAQEEAPRETVLLSDPEIQDSASGEPVIIETRRGDSSQEGTPGASVSEADTSEAAAPAAEAQAPASPPAAPAVDFGETFVKANAAYEEGDAQGAVERYTSLLAAGAESGQLYYNLGNAYLRSGELGRAVAAYRRSQARLPRNGDVRANLAFARRSAKDAIAPPAPSAVLSTLLFWHFGLSRSELAKVVLVLNLLFWGLLALRLFRRGSEALRWLTFALLLLLLATAGSLAARYFFPSRVAVVIPQEVGAHNGPDSASVVRFKLHAGTELAVKDQRDGWLRVALPEGQQGWIQKEWAQVVER